MAEEVNEFDSWLHDKLQALNTDEGVFGSYIKGILEGEDTVEDKTEALEGILSEIVESDDIPKHCKEILEKWQTVFQVSKLPQYASSGCGEEEMDVKLARLLETQARSTTVQRTNYTEEERKIREAILAQYSQMSDNEDGDDSQKERSAETKENSLVKNTNVAVVQQAEKEKRERAKQESKQKKEKDREDREKQKQQQLDKKEKRKTQKGERRR